MDVTRVVGDAYNRAIVNDSGLVFRVPEPWYWRPQDLAGKFHLTRAKLAVVRDTKGEWITEYGEVCAKMLPFDNCVAHVGSSEWHAGGFGDLQVRAYLVDKEFASVVKTISTVGAAQAKRLSNEVKAETDSRGGHEVAKAGAWTKVAIWYPRWYSDYGGTAHIDCFARQVGDKVVVMVFMYDRPDRYKEIIPAIVDSVRWLDEKAVRALFEGQAKEIPGEPIDPPPPTKQELRERRIRELNVKLKKNPTELVALIERARLLYVMAKWDEAISDFDAAHKLAPGDTAISKERGTAYRTRGISESALGLGDYKQAVADLTIAIESDPSDSGAYYFRGGAWFAQANYEKAITDYDTSIRLRKDNRDAAASYSFRGLAKNSAGDKQGALADLNRAVELQPDVAWWRANRAEYWIDSRQFRRAVADLLRATELHKAEVDYWITLTWLYASGADPAMHDRRKALETAKAGNIVRGGSEGRQALAAAHAAAGQFDEAVKWQREAIRKIHTNDEKSEAIDRLRLYQSGKPFNYFEYSDGR